MKANDVMLKVNKTYACITWRLSPTLHTLQSSRSKTVIACEPLKIFHEFRAPLYPIISNKLI
jgi:hypothetical protein